MTGPEVEGDVEGAEVAGASAGAGRPCTGSLASISLSFSPDASCGRSFRTDAGATGGAPVPSSRGVASPDFSGSGARLLGGFGAFGSESRLNGERSPGNG